MLIGHWLGEIDKLIGGWDVYVAVIMEPGVYVPGALVRPPDKRGLDPRLNGTFVAGANGTAWLAHEAADRAVLLVVDEHRVGQRGRRDGFVEVNEDVVDGMVDVVALGTVVIFCTREGDIIGTTILNPRPYHPTQKQSEC